MLSTVRLALAFLLLALGLPHPGFSDTTKISSAPRTAFPSARPESVGLSEASLTALAEEVRGYLARGLLVGGELLVIKNRRTVLHEVFGHADRDGNVPWDHGVVCNVRSMTKPLTGAAIQILADRGKIDLEDPVALYLPGFDTEKSREITIRQLLTHRGGIPLTILTSIREHADLVEMGNAVGEKGPEYEPGTRFWYSDSGTDALGAVIENVSKEKLDDFVGREILEPLEMNDSFYFLDDEDPRRSKIASLYVGAANRWERFLDPDDGAFYPYAWGSQSLYSTPMDYAKFLALWLDEGQVADRAVLSEEAVARCLNPVSEMSMLGSDARFPTSFKGLEVYYGQMSVLHVPLGSEGREPATIVGHSGSDGTIAWAWPEHDLMILFFTQSRGGTSVLRLEEAIDRLLIHPELYGTAAEVPDQFKALVGVYIADWSNHMKEEFVVHVKNGNLALDIPTQMDFELTPSDDGTRWHFAVAPLITVWFEEDENGNVDCLRIQQGPMTFEAPRKGTPHEKDFREANRADPFVLAKYLGIYREPKSEGKSRVFIDDSYLAIETEEGQLFHLWKVPNENVWVVRESPTNIISFQERDGRVVSFTRKGLSGSSQSFPRIE